MTRKKVIYLSAPTNDLVSVRQMATTVLSGRGCRVVDPGTLEGEAGAVARMIDQLIAKSDLVIQIIGCRRTPFVQGLPPGGEMTYLHALELQLAQTHHKLVHPIFLTEEFPSDDTSPPEVEPELSERHRYWRTFMKSDQVLYIPASETELASHLDRLHLGPFHTSAVARV